MKIKKVLVYAIVLFLFSCICLTEAKKVLLGVIGLEALRRMHGMQHIHNLVSFYLPLRAATQAWKQFGKHAAIAPPMPKYLHGWHQSGHSKHIKLSHEEGYELDNWLNYHFPEEAYGY